MVFIVELFCKQYHEYSMYTFVSQTLPCLVRMCSKDRTLDENVEGAETLAYLLETDAELQRTASISAHIIKTLAEYLNYSNIEQINSNGKRTVSYNQWSLRNNTVDVTCTYIIYNNIYAERASFDEMHFQCLGLTRDTVWLPQIE